MQYLFVVRAWCFGVAMKGVSWHIDAYEQRSTRRSMNRPDVGHQLKEEAVKLFVSYQVDRLGESVFGNTIIDTINEDRVVYQDIRNAEAFARHAFKAVGATVLSFHRIDVE